MIGPPLPHASPKRKIQFSLGIIVEHFEQLPCSGHGRRRLSDLRRRPPRRTRRRSSILLQGTRLSASIYHFVSTLSVFFFSLSRYLVVLIAWCVGARLILRVLGEGVGEEADGGGVCRPPIPGGVQAGAGWIRQTVPLDLGNSFFFFCLLVVVLIVKDGNFAAFFCN